MSSQSTILHKRWQYLPDRIGPKENANSLSMRPEDRTTALGTNIVNTLYPKKFYRQVSTRKKFTLLVTGTKLVSTYNKCHIGNYG